MPWIGRHGRQTGMSWCWNSDRVLIHVGSTHIPIYIHLPGIYIYTVFICVYMYIVYIYMYKYNGSVFACLYRQHSTHVM